MRSSWERGSKLLHNRPKTWNNTKKAWQMWKTLRKGKAGVQWCTSGHHYRNLEEPTTWRAGWMTNKWPFCHYSLRLPPYSCQSAIWDFEIKCRGRIKTCLETSCTSSQITSGIGKTASLIAKHASKQKTVSTASNDFEKNPRETETQGFV